MVQKDQVAPLYLQIKYRIISGIENRVYKSGDLIPSETDLGKKFDVSRITIRRSIDELVKEGYLIKKQGKGTFVQEIKTVRNLLSFGSYTDYMKKRGENPKRKIIEIKEETASEEIAHFLNIKVNEHVLVLDRVLWLDKSNQGFERDFYSLKKYPKLKNYISENTSMISILKNEYNVAFGRSKSLVNVVSVTNNIAKFMNISTGAYVYEVNKTSFDLKEDPLYYSMMFYDIHKVSFIVES